MCKRINKFINLTHQERKLFMEILFLQLMIGFLIRIIPFRWIPGLFGRTSSGAGIQHSADSNQQSSLCSICDGNESNNSLSRVNLEQLEQIKTATKRSSHISLWKNKCLVASIAARYILNKRKIPSRIFFGMKKAENGKMIAHAWLKAGNYEIVEKGQDFYELYSF